MITEFINKFVEFMPDSVDMEEGVLYISEEHKASSHKCFCGCGNEVYLPFGFKGWKYTREGDTVSLSPSVGSWNLDCQSHYFIRENKVQWC